MSAINNSINLIDRMSPVLKTIMKAMESTLKAMDQVDRASNRGMNSKAFKQAASDIREANKAIRDLNGDISSTPGLLGKVETAARRAASALASVPSKMQTRGQSMVDRAQRSKMFNRAQGNIRGVLVNNLDILKGSILSGLGSGLSFIGKGFSALGSGVVNFGKTVSSVFSTMSDRCQMAYTETLSLITLIERGIQAISGLMSFNDKITSDLAKVSLFNYDPNTTNAQAYGMVYQAAQNSRGNLSDTNQLVNRIMMSGVYGQEKGSFGAATRMAETLNKALTVSGGTSEENKRALLQLSQALSSGVLQGDELRSIREQTPYLAKVLAEGLGKIDDKFIGTTIGDLKELGAEGKLTSDVVIRAFEAMQNEVDTTFADKAPKTWGQAVDSIKNTVQVLMGYLQQMEGGPLEKISGLVWQISDYLQSEQGIQLISGIATALSVLGTILSFVVNLALTGISWIMNHANVLIAILLVLGAVALISGIQMMVAWISSVWPLLLIIAVIAIIIGLVMSTGVTAGQVVGAIAGSVTWLVGLLWNCILAVIGFFKGLWAAIGALCSNIGTAFHNVIANVKGWFYGLLATALEVIEGIVNALNKLPFVEINVSGIAALADDYAAKSAEAYGSTEEYEDVSAAYLDAYNSMDAFSSGWSEEWFGKGYDWGTGLVDSIGDFSTDLTDFMSGNEGLYDQMAGGLDNIAGGVPVNGGNLDSVGSIKSDVSLNDEDIQLLRDMAARDYLLNLQQITPVAHISFGDVRETADVNKIMDVIEDMVEEQMATALVES